MWLENRTLILNPILCSKLDRLDPTKVIREVSVNNT